MAVRNKKKEKEVAVYDVAHGTTQTAKLSELEKKYGTKNTLNLCMKEKTSISAEFFFLVLAIILMVLVFIEYFGVFRPYLAVEEAEAALGADRARLEQLQEKLEDYSDVQAEYNKYNYENFDFTLVDRLEVFELLERTVFTMGNVKSISLSRNTMQMTVDGVKSEDVDKMLGAIREEPLVRNVVYNTTNLQGGTASVSMTIVFKDAEREGN